MRKIFKALFRSFWQGVLIIHIPNPRRHAPTGERIIKSTHHFVLDLLEFVQDDALDTQARLLVPWLGLASDFECVFTLSLRACRSLTISIASYVFHLRRSESQRHARRTVTCRVEAQWAAINCQCEEITACMIISLFDLLLDATFWLFVAVIRACHLSVQTTLN